MPHATRLGGLVVDFPGLGPVVVGLIGYLAAVRDRGSGIRPWLDLYAFPALLLFYAFGLGASAARRFDNLAILFDQPVPDARGQLQPAVVGLNHPSVITAYQSGEVGWDFRGQLSN